MASQLENPTIPRKQNTTTMNDTLVSPVNAAKVMGLVLLAHGIMHALAPNPTARKYGVPSNEQGQYNVCVRSIGVSLLSTFVIVGCLIICPDAATNEDRYLAYALGTSIWLVEHLVRVLNQEASRLGGTDFPNVIFAIVNALQLYALLIEQEDWAPTAARFGTVSLLVFGLGFIFHTKFFLCKVLLCDEKRFLEDTKHVPYFYLLFRALGVTMTQCGLLTSALEFGVNPVPAFGYSCVFLTLGLVALPFSDSESVRLSFTARHFAMAAASTLLSLLMLYGEDFGRGEKEKEVF